MMDVTTNSREIAFIEKKEPLVRLRKDAGRLLIDEYYKGVAKNQEWGVKITPSSINQAFLIWSTLHKMFVHEGIAYDKFIVRIGLDRSITIEIYFGRPRMAGVTTEMYYDGKPIFSNYYARNYGNHHSLLSDEGAASTFTRSSDFDIMTL